MKEMNLMELFVASSIKWIYSIHLYCGMNGYMFWAQQTPIKFNSLHSFSLVSLIKEERIRAASLFAGAKPKEGKKDGMELLKKEWNGIPLRQRGLRPITH